MEGAERSTTRDSFSDGASSPSALNGLSSSKSDMISAEENVNENQAEAA